MKLRTLIVDDEKLAREKIRYFLELDSDIEIIGECESGQDALAFLRNNDSDILFLDIQMPLMDGFALLKRSGEKRPPAVIFVTAYDEYAVKAFEANATDYLLKPFTRKRFEEALRRVKERIQQNQTVDPTEQALEVLRKLQEGNRYLKRVAIKTQHGIAFLPAEQIDWIESEDNYVVIHSGKQSHLVRQSLNAMQHVLDPDGFLRIHRRILVNIDRIREMRAQRPAGILLQDGSILPVSRRLKEKVKRFLLRKQS
jgi:two-component system, LytTR family, response regulator